MFDNINHWNITTRQQVKQNEVHFGECPSVAMHLVAEWDFQDNTNSPSLSHSHPYLAFTAKRFGLASL